MTWLENMLMGETENCTKQIEFFFFILNSVMKIIKSYLNLFLEIVQISNISLEHDLENVFLQFSKSAAKTFDNQNDIVKHNYVYCKIVVFLLLRLS